MALGETSLLGMAMRFDVVVDGHDLGSWSACKGLTVTFKHAKVVELGQHEYTTYVPDRAEYATVVLERAMEKGDWDKTRAWLAKVSAADWLLESVGMGGIGGAGGSSAQIVLRDAKLGEVASWTLANALPTAWKGPQLDALGKRVAIETLELCHEGFLDG